MQALLSEPCHTKLDLPSCPALELAHLGVQALREEAMLTPKPGLVDQRGSGSHHDMTLELMLASADALGPGFQSIAKAASGSRVSLALREELGALGRETEARMLSVTSGINTHRGAIWTLGLLIAGCAAVKTEGSIEDAVLFAANIAAMPDRFATAIESHGAAVRRKFKTGGAKQEACDGFLHVMQYGLPALRHARRTGATEVEARTLSLLSIMATLDDTCILHRAGPDILHATKELAMRAFHLNGTRTSPGSACIYELDCLLRAAWASPGGSADLLAATLFLDSYSSSASHRFVSPERSTQCRN